MAITLLFVSTPVWGVHGGPHSTGTLSGDESGILTATFTGQSTGDTETRIREYIAYSLTSNFGAIEDVNFTPYTLTGQVNQAQSRTYVHYWVSCGFSANSFCSTDIVIDSTPVGSISNCPNGLNSPVATSTGNTATNPGRGAGFAEKRCLLNDYHVNVHNVEMAAVCTNCLQQTHGYQIIQTEVYNYTQVATLSGDFSGTYTGTFNGTQASEIDPHGIEGNATFENVTATNITSQSLTFSDLFGALQFDLEPLFLLLLFAFAILLLAEWKRDYIYYILAAIAFAFYAISFQGDENFRLLIVALTVYALGRLVIEVMKTRSITQEPEDD